MLNPLGIFVTGTGTDVGKTIVSAALTRALWAVNDGAFKGFLAIKPIQTGLSPKQGANGDSAIYAQAQSCAEHISQQFTPQTLHYFSMPASPHVAAKQESKKLCVQELCAEIIGKQREYPMLIEGAGGVCVPLNATETMLDLMQTLALPVLLVMENTLGTLNHTLLSLDILQKHGLNVVAIVCTEKEAHFNAIIKQDNIEFLQQYAAHIPIYSLPYMEGLSAYAHPQSKQAWNKAANLLSPLAEQLLTIWKNIAFAKSDLSSSELLNWDKAHLWHPYTSSIDPLPVYEVSHTKGMHIFLRHKQEPLVDGMSSWWCAVHGYGREELVLAAQRQIKCMPHVMFGGLTHAPAVRAGEKLLKLFHADPEHTKQLNRVFWADSGSVAVEVALKMALQYQQGRGEKQRTKFLSPLGGYYGDTMGAMSVCDPINGMHSLFKHAMAEHIFIPRPACAFDAKAFDESCFEPLNEAFAIHGQHLAAVIIEPIVQGAGGMWFYSQRYLQHLHKLCVEHDVLLIFDEIATGFGRTGKMFAAQWAGITADICCVGKALTGGFMNLAATLCTEDVAKGVCAQGQVFMHGPTFMGNALACAVAEASLDILARNEWQGQVLRIEKELKHGLEPCAAFADVTQVRVLGAIGVVEMKSSVNVRALQEFFVQHNVWIRPFARLIYLMPPYIASSEDVKMLTSTIVKAITLGVHK